MLLVFRPKPFSPRFATPCRPKGNTDMRIMPMTNCAMCSKSFCHDGTRSKLAAFSRMAARKAEWQRGNTKYFTLSFCSSHRGCFKRPLPHKAQKRKKWGKNRLSPLRVHTFYCFFSAMLWTTRQEDLHIPRSWAAFCQNLSRAPFCAAQWATRSLRETIRKKLSPRRITICPRLSVLTWVPPTPAWPW